MIETNFKHTEIGLIPHDWEVKTIADVAQTSSGGTPSRSVPSYYEGSIRWFTTGELCDGLLIDSLEHITPEALSSSSAKLFKEGTLLMAMYGATIGKLGILSKPSTTNQACCAIMCNDIQTKYLFFQLLFHRESIIAMGRGAGQPNISQDIVKRLQLPIPPTLAEQERIAGALSSIDTLIGVLNEQIEKKRHIKQGTMQQLLTGKKRLAGFTGEWKSVTFEDVVERFATGLNPRQNFKLNSGGALFYVTIKDFKDGVLYFDNCDRIDETAFELINKRADLREGDLLFSSIGRVGDAFVIKSTPTNWNINESVYNLRPNYSVIISDFLYHIIKGKELSNKIQDAVTGSTLRSIKMNHLKQISFSIPPTIAEQRAIANILSSMDAEIAALEQKRDKYIAIKSGMMQDLLTGKIRLV